MCPQIKWLKRERKSEKREIWKGEINRHFHPGWEGAKGARQHRAPPPPSNDKREVKWKSGKNGLE